jgi:hypothetical protein
MPRVSTFRRLLSSRRAVAAGLFLAGLTGLALAPGASAAPGWGEPRTLAVRGTAPYRATVAENPGGDAILAWVATPAGDPLLLLSTPVPVGLYAAVRPRGGDWSKPALLVAAPPTIPIPAGPKVAIGPHGDAVVVWTNDGRVLSALRPAGGPWSAVALLSSPGVRTLGDAQLASNAEGLNLVAWSEPDGPRAAERAPGAAAFGPAEPLPGQGLPLVGLDGAGTATLAWAEPSADQPNTTQLRAATRPPGGAWATETVASEALASLGRGRSHIDLERLTVSPTGTALLSWQRYGVGPAASRRDAAGAWTPAALSGTSVQAGSDRDGNVYSLSLYAVPGAATSPWLDVVPPSGATQPIALPNPGASRGLGRLLAVDGAGDAVSVWATPSADGKHMVIRSVLRARGASSASAVNIALSPSSFTDVHGLAIDAHGDALVVWIEGGKLKVAERRRNPLTMAGLRVGRSRTDAVLRFSLSGRAALRLTVARAGTGHLGGVTLSGRRGPNELRIAEPITGQPLRAGRYTVSIRAARGSERTPLRTLRLAVRYGPDGRLASVAQVRSAPQYPWLGRPRPGR